MKQARPLFSIAAGIALLAPFSLAQSGDGIDAQRPSTPQVGTTAIALPAPATTRSMQPRPIAEDAGAWRVPIHTQAADPVGGAYGFWAAGLTFKASFHDGFAFYPFLGPSYEHNLPVRWSTESVSTGGHELLVPGTSPTSWHDAWHWEYRNGAVTEAYEVRDDGVEQTFVVQRPAVLRGDLVIQGKIGSELVGPRDAANAEHRALIFADEKGRPIVSYGAAFAVDAAGNRVDVPTSYENGRVRLTVDGAWLESAVWPITVDPLLGRVTVATWGATTYGLVSYPEVGRDDEALTANVMTFYARQFSATDFDGYGRLTNDDFSSTTLVFTDVTTSWSTGRAGVCYVAGADRWAMCLERDFPSTGGNTVRVRIYTHASGNTTLNSGTFAFHDPAGGETNRYPAIGGTQSFTTGSDALLVYQADVTATKSNTANSVVYGVLFDASTNTFDTRFDVDTFGVSDDCEFPDVNPESDGGTASWIVVYQRYDNTITADDWDVQANRVDTTGAVASSYYMGQAGGSPTHKRTPIVAGRAGRYLVAMLRSDATSGFGSEIVVERFNWAEGAATPVKLGPKTILSDSVTPDFVLGGVAYDNNTDSHWGLVYQRGGYTTGDTFVARLGYSGGITEHVALYDGPNGSWSPNIAFDDDYNDFLCVFASNDNPPTGLPVYGDRLAYSTDAINVLYGSGCGSGAISANRAPKAGDEYYALRFTGMPDGTLAGLLLCAAPGAYNLGFIGMIGCTLSVNPNTLIISASGVVSGGVYQFNLPLFDSPVVIGDLDSVFAYVSPGLNPAGLGVTRGLRTQIR
ncbi:MAG: hypothetical protein U1F36_05495 [Planctomycetota bacterium]